MSENNIIYTGWREEDEDRDFQTYSTNCAGSILKWEDVEKQVQFEAQNPIKVSVNEIVKMLYTEGKSTYDIFEFIRQQTNDCCSFGTMHATDISQAYQTYRSIENKLYRTQPAWVYGCGKYYQGNRPDNGMSISSALEWITTKGVLPMNLPGMPAYSGSLQKQLLRDARSFYEQWSPKAILYDIECVPIPADPEAWTLWIRSNRAICYGTNTRIQKSGDRFNLTRSTWKHAMCEGPPFNIDTGDTTNYNSHGDGAGWTSQDVLKEIIRGSGGYGRAFGIWRFTPIEVDVDNNMIGR